MFRWSGQLFFEHNLGSVACATVLEFSAQSDLLE